MKKDLIFAPILSLIAASLFFLNFTGMTAHIIISVVGAVVLVAYTVLTKKEWKIPALEIGMRASYGVALITGIVLNFVYASVLGVFHKIFAIAFMVLLVALFIIKIAGKKKF